MFRCEPIIGHHDTQTGAPSNKFRVKMIFIQWRGDQCTAMAMQRNLLRILRMAFKYIITTTNTTVFDDRMLLCMRTPM